MPCALCGDIIPTEVARCPACGAWARRRDFRAIGVAVFMLLGFNAFIALGSGVSLLRMVRPLDVTTHDSYDALATGKALAPYTDIFMISAVLAVVTAPLFIGWLWRAYGQSTGPHRHHRAWVIFGWFLPVINLWLPPRLIHDIWVTSGRYRMAQRHAVGIVVAAWWLTVLATAGLALLFPGSGTDTLPEARLTLQIGIAAAATQALAAALCMGAVFHITRLQIDRPLT